MSFARSNGAHGIPVSAGDLTLRVTDEQVSTSSRSASRAGSSGPRRASPGREQARHQALRDEGQARARRGRAREGRAGSAVRSPTTSGASRTWRYRYWPDARGRHRSGRRLGLPGMGALFCASSIQAVPKRQHPRPCGGSPRQTLLGRATARPPCADRVPYGAGPRTRPSSWTQTKCSRMCSARWYPAGSSHSDLLAALWQAAAGCWAIDVVGTNGKVVDRGDDRRRRLHDLPAGPRLPLAGGRRQR